MERIYDRVGMNIRCKNVYYSYKRKLIVYIKCKNERIPFLGSNQIHVLTNAIPLIRVKTDKCSKEGYCLYGVLLCTEVQRKNTTH